MMCPRRALIETEDWWEGLDTTRLFEVLVLMCVYAVLSSRWRFQKSSLSVWDQDYKKEHLHTPVSPPVLTEQ